MVGYPRFLLVSSGGLLEWGHLCNSGSGLGCPGLVDVRWFLSGAVSGSTIVLEWIV